MAKSPSITVAFVTAAIWVFVVGLALDAAGVSWLAGAFLGGLIALPSVMLLHRSWTRG